MSSFIMTVKSGCGVKGCSVRDRSASPSPRRSPRKRPHAPQSLPAGHASRAYNCRSAAALHCRSSSISQMASYRAPRNNQRRRVRRSWGSLYHLSSVRPIRWTTRLSAPKWLAQQKRKIAFNEASALAMANAVPCLPHFGDTEPNYLCWLDMGHCR